MHTIKKTFLLIAIFALPFGFISNAFADFPNRTIKFYIMHKPGGGTDTTFRAFLPYFEKHLGGTIAAVNKAGGGGTKMLNFMARAKPDGYTIGSSNSPNLPVGLIQRKTHYTLDSFDYIGTVNIDPTAFSVRKDSKYKSFKDILDDARANPGKVTIATAGVKNHGMTVLRLMDALNLKFNVVHFEGGGQSRKALLGGHAPVSAQGMGSIARFHGKSIRMLVQFSQVRRPHGADIPTIKEFGINVFHNVVRSAAGPKGMPPKVLAKLRKAWKAAADDPAWHANAKKMKIPVAYISGEDLAQMTKDTYKDLKKIFETTEELKKTIKK